VAGIQTSTGSSSGENVGALALAAHSDTHPFHGTASGDSGQAYLFKNAINHAAGCLNLPNRR